MLVLLVVGNLVEFHDVLSLELVISSVVNSLNYSPGLINLPIHKVELRGICSQIDHVENQPNSLDHRLD